MRHAWSFFSALATGVIVGAGACTFDTSPYSPQTGGSTSSSGSSSSKSSVSSTTGSTSGVTTSASTTATGMTGCANDTSPAVPICIGGMSASWMGTDNFASDTGVWMKTGNATIGGNAATANGPTSNFMLLPAYGYVLHECSASIEIDAASSGMGDALVNWGDPAGNHLSIQVMSSGALNIAGSINRGPGTFLGTLRLREHNACVHVETKASGGTSWTEVVPIPTPNWFANYTGSLAFGIEKAGGADKVVFHNYDL